MIDRLFFLALAFALLAGGTLAIGRELARPAHAGAPRHVAAAATAQLPMVVVTGRRAAPATAVATTEATEASEPARRRVE